MLSNLCSCEVCNVQYVSGTTRRLSDRLRDHLQNIKSNMQTNVTKHFLDLHAKSTDSLKIQIIECVDRLIRGGDGFSKPGVSNPSIMIYPSMGGR